MASTRDRYSATAEANSRIPAEVEVGDKVYKVKRTGKAVKKIISMAPDEGDEDDAERNIEMIYEGLAVILRNPDGTHPSSEELEDELDFEVAQDLMEKFLPSSRGAEGNASPPPQTPTAPSTPATTTSS